MLSFQKCIGCRQRYELERVLYRCDCGELIEIKHEGSWDLNLRENHLSGVWKFRPWVLPVPGADIVSHPEGCTRVYERKDLSRWAGVDQLGFKHEGENPTGSFKDRGMTVAVTQAKRLGRKVLACASTGNTSASLAAYGAQAGIKTVIYLPRGKVAPSKLAQALAYGAESHEVDGDFDTALEQVFKAAEEQGLYLVNSINPFRLEGQKTIMWELFEQLGWQTPDWIVLPGGNLGNASAFGKAILEAYEAGWIKRKPRLAVIQAQGANPFYESFKQGFKDFKPMHPNTHATAINIGNPVNYPKAKRVILDLNGAVEQASDGEIREAKLAIDRTGVGCEPASAATLAGLKKLVAQGAIRTNEHVVCVLTGNLLKDPKMD